MKKSSSCFGQFFATLLARNLSGRDRMKMPGWYRFSSDPNREGKREVNLSWETSNRSPAGLNNFTGRISGEKNKALIPGVAFSPESFCVIIIKFDTSTPQYEIFIHDQPRIL